MKLGTLPSLLPYIDNCQLARLGVQDPGQVQSARNSTKGSGYALARENCPCGSNALCVLCVHLYSTRIGTSASDRTFQRTMEDKSGGLLKTSKEAQDLTVNSKSPYFKSAAVRQTSVLLLRNKTSQQHVLVTSLSLRLAPISKGLLFLLDQVMSQTSSHKSCKQAVITAVQAGHASNSHHQQKRKAAIR